jgi:hypothetical protein
MAKKPEKLAEELLSAAKWAEKLGISAAKLKKAIQEMEIAPDNVRCNCNYYSSSTIEKVKKTLK